MKQHLHTRVPIITPRGRARRREKAVKIKGRKISHLAVACAIAALTASFQAAAHQRYRVVVLPPEGGPDSYTAGYLNWINQSGVSAGYGTRTNTVTAATADDAVIWLPNGKIYDIQPAGATQSHAVWINDLGQVSGWAQNSTADSCSFGNGNQTAGFIWQFGVSRPLGTLGGVQSYGEFINDRGQVSGHSED